MNLKPASFIFAFLFSLITFSATYAQKQTLAGLNVNMNLYPDQIEWNRLNVGATFEKQLGKHGGGETGLFYRNDQSTNVSSYSDASGSYSYSYSLTTARRYLSVPVLYKYYSNRINFSAGPAFDFYLGSKQINNTFPYSIPFYEVNPKVRLGFLVKVSKTIPLWKQFILEPEIRFGSVQTLYEANLGIGIAGKYRF